MSTRPVFLAKYRLNASQRAHFAVFIPNLNTPYNLSSIAEGSPVWQSAPCKGTIIHVTGEPLMNGFVLQFKRNYDLLGIPDLNRVVLLGHVDERNLYDAVEDKYAEEDLPRARLEKEATMVTPPLRGQNIRLPIDGVTTRRCQEWTMEFLKRLVSLELIPPEAVEIAQAERDSPTHGIFGYQRQKTEV